MANAEAPNIETKGRSLLEKWLKEDGNSGIALANACGTNASSVCGWHLGNYRPRYEMRLKIEAATNGAVPADSWSTADEKKRLRALRRRAA